VAAVARGVGPGLVAWSGGVLWRQWFGESGFYKTGVIDSLLGHSPAEHVRSHRFLRSH
jgi:hypothetical protein